MPKRGQLISTAGETADKRKFDFIMKKAFVLTVLLLMATSACAQVPSAKDAKFVGSVLGRGKGWKGVDAAFAKYWNQVTPENAGKWGSVERERNRLAWDRLDVLYQFCLQHGIPFKQHTFVWGMQQPEWIANLPPGEQRKEVEDWIKSFCERYPKTAMIDVVNEPITHPPKQYLDALGGDGVTGWDWVIWAFEKARLYEPEATLILNENSILASDKKLERFTGIVKLLQKRKLIDAVGLQAHFLEIVSPKDIKRRLNKIAGLGLPIYISEFDLNIADDEAQKEKCKAVFPVFWEHRAVKGITLWGYKEGRMWRKRGYLLREDGSERPTMTWLREYLQRQVQK